MTDMQTPFALILHSGNTEKRVIEAIAFARQGDFENASEKMRHLLGRNFSSSSYSKRLN